MAMQESVKSSGQVAVTAGANVCTGPSRVHFVSITPAAAASSVTLYDNAATGATGTILLEAKVAASVGSVVIPLSNPVMALQGVSIVVTGSGATAVVHYSLD